MYNEKDARLLYIRAIKQYTATSKDISIQEKTDADRTLEVKGHHCYEDFPKRRYSRIDW